MSELDVCEYGCCRLPLSLAVVAVIVEVVILQPQIIFETLNPKNVDPFGYDRVDRVGNCVLLILVDLVIVFSCVNFSINEFLT
jgi:hypothetical protein